MAPSQDTSNATDQASRTDETEAEVTAHSENEVADTAGQRRARRAREENMDIVLRRYGGIYDVRSESGTTYQVDVLEQTCTCPDSQQTDPPGGCKHLRRVETDIQAGRVPRPDGKLPTNVHPEAVLPDGGDLSTLDARIRDALREREDELASLETELRALNFVFDMLTALRPESDTTMDAVLHRPETDYPDHPGRWPD